MTTATAYEWNTGRQYAADGQRIVAEVSADGVLFYDMSRGIYGSMPLPAWGKLSDASAVRSYVMGRYDRNAYESNADAHAFFVRCAYSN